MTIIWDSLAAEQVKTLFGAPRPSITREAKSIERSSRCTPSSRDASPQGRRREYFSQTRRMQDKLDTMGLESLPLPSRTAELSIQTWKPCPGGVSSAPLEDAPLPGTKDQADLRLKKRLPVAKEGPGIPGGGSERNGAEREMGREKARGQRRSEDPSRTDTQNPRTKDAPDTEKDCAGDGH